MQVGLAVGGSVPQRGTVLTVPEGVPRRGKVGAVPLCGRDSAIPRSLRGTTEEGSHLLPRRHPPQALPGPVVQVRVDPLEFRSADARKGRLLGMESADQAVGVFIRASLPGMIGLGEKHIHVGRSRQRLVPGKLLAVVEREAQSNHLGQCFKLGADPARDLFGFLAVRTPDQREPRASLDQGDQVSGLVRTIDQVAFPMPDGLARLHLGRAGVNPALIGNSSSTTTFLSRTAPMPLTSRTWQIHPKLSSGFGIGINVLVDRLLAHPRPPIQPGSVADDIRCPSVFESRLGVDPNRLGETSRPRASGLRLRLHVRLLRPIASPARVPQNLTTDAACRTPQSPAHLSQAKPFLTPTVNKPTFFLGHALVSQCRSPRVATKNVAYRVTFSYTGVAIAGRARELIKAILDNVRKSTKIDKKIGR